MNNLVKINNQDLQVKEFRNQRIVTFKDIDKVHERVKGTAKRNFAENKGHLIENVDYFLVKGDELRGLKQSTNFVLSNAREIILITESGYLMLVKSLSDDLAWEVQRQLVNNYFRVQALNPYAGMSKELQAIFTLDKKTIDLGNRVEHLENNMTIDYSQQEKLNTLARIVVVQALGGKGTPAYKELNKKAFSALWRDYKRIMQVNSYKNTAVKEFAKAEKIINSWKPNRELQLMIVGANSQISF